MRSKNQYDDQTLKTKKFLHSETFLYSYIYLTSKMENFKNYLNSFSKIPEEQVDALISIFNPKALRKGDFYAKEGEICKKLAFLSKGIIRAYYQNDKGVEYNKLFFQEPAIVAGYSSLITGQENLINIQCLTDCEIFEVNFKQIIDLYEKHPLIERLNRSIAEDFFVKKERREMSLVMNDADKRYEMFKEEYPQLENDVPQYQIASYLGITATQLSRIRAQKN